MIYRSKPFPFPHGGVESGLIEFDLADPLRPVQRHVWIHESGEIEVEPWLRTGRTTAEALERTGFKRIDP